MNKSRLAFKRFGFHISENQIRDYMHHKGILQVEFDTENNTALALEPVQHGERQFWIETWFKEEITTEQLLKKLHERFQWTEYIDIRIFLESVETWLRNQN